MKKKKNKLLKEFKAEWSLKSFKIFILATSLLVINLIFFSKVPLIFIPLHAFWIFSFFWYEILKKKNLSSKFYSWYIFILNIIFFLLYLVFSFKFTIFTIYFFVGSIFILLLLVTLYSIIILFWSKRNLPFLIFSYILMVFLTIILFGYVFTFISAFEGQEVIITGANIGAKLTAWDYVYFSSGNFYAMSFGDLIPKGWAMKIFSQVELMISALIHVILLGDIISRRFEENKKKISSNRFDKIGKNSKKI